jgi:Mn-containing catalase
VGRDQRNDDVLFQGWNCRGPAKYRDMLLDIGTEEIAHVEMPSTMIARLLETSPVETYKDEGLLSMAHPRMHGTPPVPVPPTA